jgi:hypothetical protein
MYSDDATTSPNTGPQRRNATVQTLTLFAVSVVGLAMGAPVGAADDDASDAAATAQPLGPLSASSADDTREEPRRAGTDDGDGDAEQVPEPVTVIIVPESPESQQVCRNVRVTGTRLPHRECRTVADWEATDDRDREVAQRYLDSLMERSRIRNPDEGDRFIRSGLPGFQ